MDIATFLAFALACAPQVHPDTLRAIVSVESSFNPHAIGVVGGRLIRQPRSGAEAEATTAALDAGGWGYSVGLGQINVANFRRLGLTRRTALDPCSNLAAAQTVLDECYGRTSASSPAQLRLRGALSCYYSGAVTGLRDGYVQRVVAAARSQLSTVPRAPSVRRSIS